MAAPVKAGAAVLCNPCKGCEKMIEFSCAIRREMITMARFVPKDKMSKKAQKELNRQRRVTWEFSPVTKTVDSRKIYSRKRKAQNRGDYDLSFFYAFSVLSV